MTGMGIDMDGQSCGSPSQTHRTDPQFVDPFKNPFFQVGVYGVGTGTADRFPQQRLLGQKRYRVEIAADGHPDDGRGTRVRPGPGNGDSFEGGGAK